MSERPKAINGESPSQDLRDKILGQIQESGLDISSLPRHTYQEISRALRGKVPWDKRNLVTETTEDRKEVSEPTTEDQPVPRDIKQLELLRKIDNDSKIILNGIPEKELSNFDQYLKRLGLNSKDMPDRHKLILFESYIGSEDRKVEALAEGIKIIARREAITVEEEKNKIEGEEKILKAKKFVGKIGAGAEIVGDLVVGTVTGAMKGISGGLAKYPHVGVAAGASGMGIGGVVAYNGGLLVKDVITKVSDVPVEQLINSGSTAAAITITGVVLAAWSSDTIFISLNNLRNLKIKEHQNK